MHSTDVQRIPATVKKIGKQAFYGYKKLKTVTIKTTKLSSSKIVINRKIRYTKEESLNIADFLISCIEK